MSLKKSEGNMYPWVTHTHAHLGGECPHKCKYCYVDNPRWGRPEKYKGELRLIEKEFGTKYGEGKTIFMENCNDLFAAEVPADFIRRIIAHSQAWPNNAYVFQSKRPARMVDFAALIPENSMIGTTIETNRDTAQIGQAPHPKDRYRAMLALRQFRSFVTIEPIIKFDLDELAGWISEIQPEFVNIGADSKNHGLPEPTIEEVDRLISKLKGWDIEIREKHNLGRLRNG